jgi:hypothetical protein
MRALALLALLALAPACARELGPEASYRALVKAMAERDADRAWSLLSAASQKRLDALARAAAARAPGVVPASGRQLLIGDAALASPSLVSVSLQSQSGDRAALQVEEAGRAPRRVVMVREGGRWRVELPEVASGQAAP